MVHWDRKKYRRRLLLQILMLLLAAAALSYFFGGDKAFAPSASPFEIERSFQIPMKEISGAALREGTDGPEIVLVGDRKAEIYSFRLGEKKSELRSFRQLLVDRFSLCRSSDFEDCSKSLKKLASNWEALRIDASRRSFVLQEHTQSVIVLDREASRIEKVLHFNFAEAFPDVIARGSKKFRKNALGEGLILLRKGHILVAKEQYPTAFAEFGPAGDAPLGLSAQSVLPIGESFKLPSGGDLQVDLKPLAHWIVSGHAKCDMSDIDHDGAGQLLVLSQSCRQISRFASLVPGKEAQLLEALALPVAIKNPEALVVWGDRWLIGSDMPHKRDPNLFLLRQKAGSPPKVKGEPIRNQAAR